jgi:hypothetical protein
LNSGQKETINIRLTEDAATLNEVLVTGKSAVCKINELAYNVVALDAKLLYNSGRLLVFLAPCSEQVYP